MAATDQARKFLRLAAGAGSDPALEANKAVVRRLIEEVWNGGNMDVLPEIISEDTVDHAAPPEAQGLAGARFHIESTRAGFSDIRLDLTEVVAEGDLVATEMLWSGYHDGPVFGLPPTYKWAHCRQSCTYRVENGKIAELWQVVDMLGMLVEMGIAPGPDKSPPGILFHNIATFFKMGLRQVRKPPKKPPPPAGYPFDIFD
jgi:predicted ester cyclase